MSAGLVLHWHLDDLTPESRAIDSGDGHINGTVEGDPAIRPDPKFGSCLAFDGARDALTADDTPALRLRAYTVAAWVNLSPIEEAAAAGIVGEAKGLAVSADAEGRLRHSLATTEGDAAYLSPPGSLKWDTWHHVAVTDDGTTARTYVDGIQVAEMKAPGDRPAAGTAFVAGRDPAERKSYLKGLIAHVRVYDGAIGPLEIQRDMAADEAALAAFVRTHPLEFELVNADQQAVLYIDDAPAGQALTLRLVNTSRQDLEFRPVPDTDKATPDAHHLVLRLRPGTLATSAPPRLATAGWSILTSADATAVYLLAAGPTLIHPGESREVVLEGMKADGSAGTRGTRVQLDYQRLGYAGEPDELTGGRVRFLDVVNHRGRPDAPLAAGFTGGDRVLSDGATPSALRIRVANLSRDAGLALVGATAAPESRSAIVISFEVRQAGEDRDWALTEAGRAGDATLTVTATETAAEWTVVREDLGQSPRWTLTPRTDTTLPPGGSLELRLGDIYALPTPGHAPVAVAYQNIPGYRDGAISIMAERTPLLFTATSVGIGIAEPSAPLTVSASGGHLQLRRESDADGGGKVLYLELFQADHDGEVFPSIRFHHSNKFWHRVEARPEGFYLKTGLLSSDDPVNLYAGAASFTSLRLGGAAGTGLAADAPEGHLQLRREPAPGADGRLLFLELFQPDSATPVYPSIRFHHSNKFWHRIEARPEGFYLKTGLLTADDPVNLYAGAASFTSLTIGGVTIGAGELGILRRLALGTLEVDLYNLAHQEYAFAGTFMYDNDRRYVLTWATRNERVTQGGWRLAFPR
ncbi:LamG-like jellyroll fold domain-containing protein [Nonomuraea sp. NPDC050536]|uniref:LamG-like jellyroll fold domain-containing protein n=1 Tax=Nonomuraea sp. NPDC050536 TaxID=3364366 RepID=UPI0037C7E4EF